MARKVIIPLNPSPGKNYFLLDANVLVYRALPRGLKGLNLPPKEPDRVRRCLDWFKRIESQIKRKEARVYVADITIAEAFKTLAKWYYRDGWFATASTYIQAKERLRRFVATTYREMSKANRFVGVHDEPVNRDVIIGVDRFFEVMFKSELNVRIADLLLLSIGKYLIDFYDIPSRCLFILTSDKALIKLTKKLSDVPTAIDPTDPRYEAKKTFR
jgi:hypothetical protein